MSVDKIIRFSAEDNGLSDKINRIGQELRDAFSGLDMGNILREADEKFDKISDKLKYINEQVQHVANSRNAEFEEKIERIDEGGGNEYYKNRQRSQVTQEQQEYNNKVSELVDVFHKFLKELEKVKPSGKEGDESRNFANILHEILRGNAHGVIGRTAHSGVHNMLTNMVGNMEGWGAAAGGVIATTIAGLIAANKFGNEDLRSENRFRRIFRDTQKPGGDIGDQDNLGEIGMSRSEMRDFGFKVGLGRRSSENLADEVQNRARIMRSLPLSEQDINGFDRFFRKGTNGMIDSGSAGGDAVRIIGEILQRSEKNGFLGLNKEDFLALPEKIQQVQNILQLQYQNGEKVNSDLAINLINAGQRIGGRFADDRASGVFGAIDEGIKNPSTPGSRAFMFESLRQANPGASYTDILAKMENGMSAENLQAILPSLANLPDGEQKRMLIKGLFPQLKQQDANRLAAGGNLNEILGASRQGGVAGEDVDKQINTLVDRNKQLTLEIDKATTNLINEFKRFANAISTVTNNSLKDPMRKVTMQEMMEESGFSDRFAHPFNKLNRNNKVVETDK